VKVFRNSNATLKEGGTKRMAGLTGKDGERCKGKEAESGRPKTIARRSLKDILAATNSQAKDR